MARKSRKNIDSGADIDTSNAMKKWNVGAYVRLSAVDRKKKGDSIENQQAIISAFISGHSDMILCETYIDNGATGQTFKRDGFQRMLADMESGKIDCCISKDLSRLGRNAIDTGYYIEKHFPMNNIRYIAINDNYDSADASGGIMLSLKNMVNETYAIEVGRKVHSTRQMNINNGCFVGSYAPFGYLKDPSDGHKLVIDSYSSKIVLNIFEMFASGSGGTAILQHLNEQEIMPPNLYRHTQEGNAAGVARSNRFWSLDTIYEILKNRIYCGDMVQGIRRTNHHVVTYMNPSEVVITENTHEPIVSRKLFEAVQRKKTNIKKPRVNTEANIFSKKLFCGHCGYSIHHEKRQKSKDAYYQCMSQIVRGKDTCGLVSISGASLKTQVLEALQKQALELGKNRLRQAPVEDENEKTQSELIQTRQELGRISGFLKGLYESFVEGDITKSEYGDMKQNYENRIAALTEREKQLLEEMRERSLQDSKLNKAGDSLDRLVATSDLTAEVVDALIEKILLFKDKSIEVRFKFSDKTVKSTPNEDFVWRRNRRSKKELSGGAVIE